MAGWKKLTAATLTAVLLATIVGATPRQASAGFGSSPGREYGPRHTSGITDGTSNTVVVSSTR